MANNLYIHEYFLLHYFIDFLQGFVCQMYILYAILSALLYRNDPSSHCGYHITCMQYANPVLC